MSLKDLFRPKWQHSNASIRISAVGKINDQGILFGVATGDDDSDVREAAVERLTDPQFLMRIVEDDTLSSTVRARAVMQLPTDQDFLSNIVRDCTDSHARSIALIRLSDQDIFRRIAFDDKDSDVRQTAVRLLENQNDLLEIALNDKDRHVRESAVQCLTGQGALAQVVEHESSANVRMAAVRKLTDGNMLADIAKNDKAPNVRKVAVEKVPVDTSDSRNAIREIASADSSHGVRLAAARRLSSKDVLMEVLERRPDRDKIKEDYYELLTENTTKAMVLNSMTGADMIDERTIFDVANEEIMQRYDLVAEELGSMQEEARVFVELAQKTAKELHQG